MLENARRMHVSDRIDVAWVDYREFACFEDHQFDLIVVGHGVGAMIAEPTDLNVSFELFCCLFHFFKKKNGFCSSFLKSNNIKSTLKQQSIESIACCQFIASYSQAWWLASLWWISLFGRSFAQIASK